ncbi:hypothetical protein NZK35_14225 [Stieleria sp. ICT_E10.1]|uniref:hypothetical protein n=1 Tax=Stieleria sedimenti TaxID=2976331 RepID=UPI0021805A97|nr:hypothetical protein [Stieleria sedimenti]MCS7467805.1 hypothetical protein [Stieleria sedimenti]
MVADRLTPTDYRLLVGVLFLLIGSVADLSAADSGMRFLLADGSVIDGTLSAAEEPAKLRINTKLFAQPIEISTQNLLEARREPLNSGSVAGDGPETSTNTFAFLLSDGSRFVGNVVSWLGGLITLETEDLGRVSFAAQRVVRIVDQASMPHQILALSDARYRFRRETGWNFTGQGMSCTVPESTAVAGIDLPDRFRIRVEVACAGTADFELSLGDRSQGGAGQGGTRVDRRGGSISRLPTERFVTRVEWFGESVSLVRSNASVSDAGVFDVSDSPGRLELDLYGDQRTGRLLAYRDGVLQADVSLVDEEPVVRRELTLINRGDPVQLTSFELFHWDGQPPPSQFLPDRFTLFRDGSIIDQVAEGWDANRFQIDGTWYAMDDLTRMEFAVATQVAPACDLSLSGGSRVRGQVEGRDSDGAILVREGTGTVLAVAPSRVTRWVGRSEDVTAPPGEAAQFQADGVSMWGRLLDGRDVGATFGWRSLSGENDVGIAATEGVTIRFASTSDSDATSVPDLGMLQLRCGDRLPGQLVSIQPNGVRFQSDWCGEVLVALGEVRRIRTGPAVAAGETDAPWLTRLPRRMADSPPTHLLVSPNGDVLRGRLLSMDEDAARIEIRGRTRLIKRSSVAEVIWLGPSDEESAACRYVITTRDGARLGLQTAGFDGRELSGRQTELGNCRVPAAALESLRFGTRDASPGETWDLVPVKQPKTFE